MQALLVIRVIMMGTMFMLLLMMMMMTTCKHRLCQCMSTATQMLSFGLKLQHSQVCCFIAIIHAAWAFLIPGDSSGLPKLLPTGLRMINTYNIYIYMYNTYMYTYCKVGIYGSFSPTSFLWFIFKQCLSLLVQTCLKSHLLLMYDRVCLRIH